MDGAGALEHERQCVNMSELLWQGLVLVGPDSVSAFLQLWSRQRSFAFRLDVAPAGGAGGQRFRLPPGPGVCLAGENSFFGVFRFFAPLTHCCMCTAFILLIFGLGSFCLFVA
jgi:hypothetical protein